MSVVIVGLLVHNSPASGQPVSATLTDPAATHAGYTHRAWTTDDGLPQNSATALAQTRDGYLWIGTFQGLARFDGVRFTVFEAATTDGLEDDRITTLLEDREGGLWIGTEAGGLSLYQDGRFTHFTTEHGLLDNHVLALYEDVHGLIWASTTTGLVYWQRQDERPAFTVEPRVEAVSAFHNDATRPDIFWLSTSPLGLVRIQQDTQTMFTTADGLLSNWIFTLAASRDGSLWIGTDSGINRLKEGRITSYPMPGTQTRKIFEDRSGTLWAAVEGRGLLRFDGSGFVPLGPPGDVIGTTVIYALEDREGSLWVGTNGNGLHRLTERLFTAFTVEEGLPGHQVHGVFEDHTGAIWAGTASSGLVRLQDRSVTRYALQDGLSSNLVWSLAEDDEGRLWVGGKGPVRFDGERFVLMQHEEAAVYADFRVLTRSSSRTLWLGAWRGVFRYREGQLALVLGRERLPESGVQALYEAPSGALWIGMRNGGLCRYADEALTCYTTNDGLSNNNVRALYSAAPDTLWIGTYGGGLCQLASEQFTCLTKQHGLPDGTVHHILEDGLGFVWLPSNKGIFRLARREVERFFAGEIDRVYPDVYGTSDGMPSSECNGGFQPAGWKARDGRLWFPTAKGLAVVDPALVAAETVLPAPPPVYVEHVMVDGELAPLREPLALEAGSDRLVFRYTAPYLSAPEKVHFRHQLVGHDRDWVEAGVLRTATYTNLPPDDYIFRVQAAIGNGPWSEQGADQPFVLKPHFFQTAWFLALCGLGGLAFLFSLYGLRVRSLKQRQHHLEALVKERTYHLQAEKRKTEEQAQRLEELDRAKNRFFANVSHEFRTPLMLITGPLEQGLTTIDDPDELERQEGVMLRNARRLLRLVNQLLDLAKLESGRMSLQAAPGDLTVFLHEIVRTFQPLAERKLVALNLRAEVEHLPFVFDADKLEKAISNLVSNALKFTPEGGKVWVTLHGGSRRVGESKRRGDETSKRRGEAATKSNDQNLKSEVDGVEITVKDTGPGIPAEALGRIFERFEQVDDSATRAHEGTGIGLALARELVELHGGTILVESEPGFGSAFTIRIPFSPEKGREAPDQSPAQAPPTDEAIMGAVFEGESMPNPSMATVLQQPRVLAVDLPAEKGSLERHIQEVPKAPLVLLVEDNAEVRALVRGYLEPTYHVLEAENGKVGLEAAREAMPDLILSDVMMPELDGFGLVRAVKADERLRAIPVVLLTARASEQDTVEGLESGADDYLAKPFSADELRARVARHIAARRQLREQFSRELRVEPAGISVPAEEEVFLAHVLDVVEAQMGEGHFGPEALAEAVGLSPRQLRRRLQAVTGQTPHRFIQQIRLQRAAQLLEARAGTVAEVAYRVGFKNESHFSRAFREHFGHTPTEHLSERDQT